MTDVGTPGWNEGMYAKYATSRAYLHPNPLVRFVEGSRMRRVVSRAKVAPGERVLEVGCEAGFLLESLPAGATRVGLDIAGNALADARGRLGASVALAQGDGGRLPFKDGAFDVVVCSETLEHVPDPKLLIEEMHRVLKPGGRFVASVPYEAKLDAAKRFFVRIGLFRLFFGELEEDQSSWHVQSFTPRAFRRALSERFAVGRVTLTPLPVLGPKIVATCTRLPA